MENLDARSIIEFMALEWFSGIVSARTTRAVPTERYPMGRLAGSQPISGSLIPYLPMHKLIRKADLYHSE